MRIITGCNKLQKNVYGDWRTKDISETYLSDLTAGAHILSARAFGLKGHLGGYHTWLAFVDADSHTVFEITDVETVLIQANKHIVYSFHRDSSLALIKSNRRATQKWFGSNPEKLVSLPTLTLLQCEHLVETYKSHVLDSRYHLLKNNCNTFVSWVLYKTSTPVTPRIWRLGMRTNWNNFNGLQSK